MLKGIYPSVCGRLPNTLDAYRTLTTEECVVNTGESRCSCYIVMERKVLPLIAIILMMVFSQFPLGKVQAQASLPELSAEINDDLVTLRWNPDSNAIEYRVYMAETKESYYYVISSPFQNSFSIRIGCGKVRYFFIVGYDGTYENRLTNYLEVRAASCISKTYAPLVAVP